MHIRLAPVSLIFATSLGLATTVAANAPAAPGDQVTLRYSFSGDNALKHGNAPGGEIEVNAGFLDWRSSVELSAATRLNYGAHWNGYSFTRSGPMAVPQSLHAVSLALGGIHRPDRQWSLIANAQPGFYGDFQGGSLDGFNIPAMLLASHSRSRDLVWSFGLRIDAFADHPVIPFVGVNWRFAPDWEFNLGLPRAGLTYGFSPTIKLGLGLTLQGGSYHIAEDPRPVSIAAGPRLDDTHLDYREIRVGLAADCRLNSFLTLTLEAGVITDQKFDYHEHDYTIDGGATAFLTVGLAGRF